jgi:hypothetical protein
MYVYVCICELVMFTTNVRAVQYIKDGVAVVVIVRGARDCKYTPCLKFRLCRSLEFVPRCLNRCCCRTMRYMIATDEVPDEH